MHRLGMGRTARSGPRAGLTLIEVSLAIVVLSIAMLGLAGSVIASLNLNATVRETNVAREGAKRVLETMVDPALVPFADIFASYNADPADDPGGAGTGSGDAFDVQLDPQDGDADGRVGFVSFPTVVNAGVLELREDVVDDRLGMPRDLNGDGLVDDQDHADDYVLLPVRVTLEWKGVSGERSMVFETMIAEQ